MATRSGCCSIPSGQIYIGAWGGLLQAALGAGTFYPQMTLTANEDAGNVDATDIKYAMKNPKLANMNSRAGGTSCSAFWIESASVSMTIRCGRASNIALALLGRNNFIAGSSVTNEDHIVQKNTTNAVQAPAGTFVPFNRIPDVTQTITVTGAGGTPTYVAGTDYIVTETGILIPPTSSIAAVTAPYATPNVRLSYTALDTVRTDALVITPQDVSIYCDGFDRSSGAQMQTHIYRAKGVSDGIPLIAEDFIKLNMTFEILPDTRIPVSAASPTSQYFHQLRG